MRSPLFILALAVGALAQNAAAPSASATPAFVSCRSSSDTITEQCCPSGYLQDTSCVLPVTSDDNARQNYLACDLQNTPTDGSKSFCRSIKAEAAAGAAFADTQAHNLLATSSGARTAAPVVAVVAMVFAALQ